MLIEMTRAMMSDSQMSMPFWCEAVCTAAHIRNRIKSRVHGKTPYEMWHGRRPNITYMKRFGCAAYVLNKEVPKGKFEPKTLKGIFVGYAPNNTYRVYIPETGKIKNDCDVKFDENEKGVDLLRSGPDILAGRFVFANSDRGELSHHHLTIVDLSVGVARSSQGMVG